MGYRGRSHTYMECQHIQGLLLLPTAHVTSNVQATRNDRKRIPLWVKGIARSPLVFHAVSTKQLADIYCVPYDQPTSKKKWKNSGGHVRRETFSCARGLRHGFWDPTASFPPKVKHLENSLTVPRWLQCAPYDTPPPLLPLKPSGDRSFENLDVTITGASTPLSLSLLQILRSSREARDRGTTIKRFERHLPADITTNWRVLLRAAVLCFSRGYHKLPVVTKQPHCSKLPQTTDDVGGRPMPGRRQPETTLAYFSCEKYMHAAARTCTTLPDLLGGTFARCRRSPRVYVLYVSLTDEPTDLTGI